MVVVCCSALDSVMTLETRCLWYSSDNSDGVLTGDDAGGVGLVTCRYAAITKARTG